MPSSSQRTTRPASGAQSVERALALLRLVTANPSEGVALATLTAQAGLDRTTAYRLLSTLLRAGLLQREAGGTTYRLGNEALVLGLAAQQRPLLIEQLRPALKSLARRSGEPVFLSVRCGDHSHCLHLEEGPRPVRSFADSVGVSRLLGLGIPSFSFLARMEDAAIQAHYQRHAAEYKAQRLTWPVLLRWVSQTRTLGYAQISAKGLRGVGMRFDFGSCGEGAVGIVGPGLRVTKARAPALAELLREELGRCVVD